ncbi:unnamed protein product, partial [marine sediment metagenome]
QILDFLIVTFNLLLEAFSKNLHLSSLSLK